MQLVDRLIDRHVKIAAEVVAGRHSHHLFSEFTTIAINVCNHQIRTSVRNGSEVNICNTNRNSFGDGSRSIGYTNGQGGDTRVIILNYIW